MKYDSMTPPVWFRSAQINVGPDGMPVRQAMRTRIVPRQGRGYIQLDPANPRQGEYRDVMRDIRITGRV